VRVVFLGCVVLAGCGRLSFDATGADAAAGADSLPDTPTVRGPCAINPSVADPLTISGETFAYTGFNNATGPVPGTVVRARDASSDAELASTTSDAAGLYALAVPTGGAARHIRLEYAPPGYWTTTLSPDRPLDRAVTGINTDKWRLGDGPVWSDGQMGSVYGSVGVARDMARGTLNIAVRTCDEESLEGVTLEVQPAPELFGYTDGGGFISTALTATVAPYTSAAAFNAVPGLTRIRASAPGLTFGDVDVVVLPGNEVTYVVLHPGA